LAKIFLGIPHTGMLCSGILTAVASNDPTRHAITVADSRFGCLTQNFNVLWCQALNARARGDIDYFAMCHSDVRPSSGWLDTLVEEIDRTGADILSVAVAIKDDRGLTSMGRRREPLESWVVDRITLKELYQLPESFGLEDCRKDDRDHHLAINTGLWICRFDRDWTAQFPGFHVCNRLGLDEDGHWMAQFFPEDWLFSHWAACVGLKVMATRKVLAWHTGAIEYATDSPWGRWDVDYGALGLDGPPV
jgi:hypothetical protein